MKCLVEMKEEVNSLSWQWQMIISEHLACVFLIRNCVASYFFIADFMNNNY